MKFIYGGFIFIVLCMSSFVEATPFQTCKNGAPPKELRSKYCNSIPCHFFRGQNITAEWDFIIKENTKTLKPRVKLFILDNFVDTHYTEDSCSKLKNTRCPLISGQEVTYQLYLPIDKVFPRIQTTIEIAYLDDNNKLVMCFHLPIVITDS